LGICSNECGRCNIACKFCEESEKGYRGELDIDIDIESYMNYLAETPFECYEYIQSHLWREGAPEERLEKILKKLLECIYESERKPIEYTRKHLTCTEKLAIYCGSDDTIYYNMDRIREYMDKHALDGIGMLLKLLVKSGMRPFIEPTLFKYCLEIAGLVSSSIIHIYLTSHEKYHWSTKGSSVDEEAKATAYGLYKTLTTVNNLIKNIKFVHNRLIYPVFNGDWIWPLEPIPYVMSELIIHNIIKEHLQYSGYRDFYKYLGVKNGKLRPPMVKDSVIELPILGLRIIYHIDHIHVMEILPTLEFVFKATYPSRRDNVKEITGCCDLPISYMDPWISTG